MTDDKSLRDGRLIFYKELVDDINKVLREFLRLSNAQCALLVDKEGHMVTRQGTMGMLEKKTETVSALVAGCFAATKQLANLIGEEEFPDLFHQGKALSIQLTLVGDRTLLTVVFDDTTTVGMVRVYSQETSSRLAQIFADHEKRQSENPHDPSDDLEDDYVGGAKDKLDDLFGG